MKYLLVLVGCLIAGGFVAADARAQADAAQPSSANVPGAQFPQVSADGRVTFRIEAKDAHGVAVEPFNGNVEDTGYNGLGSAPYPMTRDRDGYWTVTTPPIVPGFHYYTLLIDGVSVLDPSSRSFFGAMRELSAVEVPERGVDFYLPHDVPHGEVRTLWYWSRITAQWQRVLVYVPPGYDADTSRRYPVLYLRHGGGEDETGWINQGHANFILDNLIAAGRARPMILVMGSGYAGPRNVGRNPGPAARARSMAATVDMAANELVPEIDSHFRTLADRQHRAIAGLSMGAAQTLTIAAAHLDLFSAIGAFSRPPVADFNVRTSLNGVMADAARFNRQVSLLWFGAGTAETGIFNSLRATRLALDKAGIHYTYVEYPGLAHEWQSWRKQLDAFAPLLFRQ